MAGEWCFSEKNVPYVRPRPGALLNQGGPSIICILTKQATGRRVVGHSQAPLIVEGEPFNEKVKK